MDVGKLQITVDLNADDLAAEITKAVEKQLEPVLAKIREQINATARDLNKIDGKKFIEVAVDAKAAQQAVDAQGRASAKAAGENEANAKALRDLARAEAEFAAAQKSGDLVARTSAMAKLTQATKDYEAVTGRSAGASRDFADNEVKNLDKMGQAAERRSTVSARTARAQIGNNKAIQDALNKTAEVAEQAAARRAKAEQKVRDEVDKTEKRLDEAARREAERMAARAAGGGGSGGGGGGGSGGGGSGGGGSGGGGTGVYGGRNFVTRFAMNPIGANVIGLGLAGVPAATLVVTDLASALGQLANTGLVLPGVFAGIGASVGTLAVGLSGMKKAVTDLYTAIKEDDPKALKKANDELKDMAPAARDTATAIAQLAAGPLTDLKRSVQGKIFDGTANEIKQLSDVLIPHLNTGMGSVATAWNRTIKTLGATAMQGGNLSLVDQIFGNTAQAQNRADAAIAPLTHGLAQLSASGTNFLPRLADGLTKVSTRFDQFISKAAASGDLDKWISSGLTGMTHLGDAAINFGKTLEGIFKADGSRNFLEWLDKATQRWAQFTNSTKGQEQLKAFFREAADDLHRWEPVLGNLFKLLGQIIGGAQAWSAVMLPFLQSASSLLLHMPFLVQGITAAFLAWRTISGVSNLLNMLGRITGTLDAVPAKARAAAAAIDEVDAESAVGGGAGGSGGRGRRGGSGGGRLGRLGRGAGAIGGFIGLDQLMQGVDPGNASGGGVGGWLQAIGGGAGTGAMIGMGGGPETAVIGAVIGAAGAALTKGIETIFAQAPKPGALVPGALQGDDYRNALNQQVMPSGPRGAPWNQQLIDQAVYGSSDSFDPRNSVFGQMNKGDANYQSILAEMSKPGGAYSSIPGLTAQNAPEMLDKIMAQAKSAGSALDSLKGQITDLPSGEVVLTDPTPDIIERVKKLGGMVHSLPNGLIAIDTSQLNAAQHQADDLAAKLAKIMVPGMGLSADGKGLIPMPSAPPAAAGSPQGQLSAAFPIPGAGFASGGIIRRFDEGGTGDPSGGSPWRVAAQIGSQFIDEATMVAIKAGQAAMKGGTGALSTAADVAGHVIGPLGIAAPFAMDAIDPQARTTSSDVTPLNRGKALPDSSFAGMLPGYTPGQDTMTLPLYGGGKYALSGGEGVVIPEAMAALGPDWLYGINSQFRPGLPKGNYASGGILGRFAPGGMGGGRGGGLGSDDSTNDILKSISALLGGSKYGPLTAMQYSGVMQQQYLQRIATGGALNGTLAPGTTPGRLGPWGTPVKPINIGEALARGAIQGLGGNPDIAFGPDSVDYAIQQSNAIESALKQAAGQPGGIAALGRPTDPAAYTDALTRFAQTGQITPDMKALGLDVNSPVIGALQSARMEKGPDRANIPAYIAQSLSPGGYTGPITDENKGLLGALGTFSDQTTKNGLAQQQLNMTLAPYGGIPALPGIIAKNPQLQALLPGAGGAAMPGAGGAGGGNLWDMVAAAESGTPGKPGTANWAQDGTGSNHYGGLQFDPATWRAFGGVGRPQDATREQQIEIANRVAFTGYNGQAPQGLGAWESITKGMVPGVTTSTPQSAFASAPAAPAAPPGSYPQMPPLMPAAGPATPGADASTAPPVVPPGQTAYWTPQGWLSNGQVIPGAAPAAGQPTTITGPATGGAPPPAPPVAPPPVPGQATGPVGDWRKMFPGGPPPPPTPPVAPPPAPSVALAPVPGPTGGFWNPGPGATLDSIHQPNHPGWTFSDTAGPVLQNVPVAPPAPPAAPRAQRPVGPAPDGMTWDDATGTWIPVHQAFAGAPPVVAPSLIPPGIGGPPPAAPVVSPPGLPVVPPPAAPAGVMPPMVAVPSGTATQNGWYQVTNPGQLTNLPIPGGAQIASGAPAAMLGDFAQWFNANIEPIKSSGGYRSGTDFDHQIGSNHMSGTALDLNPDDFPGSSGGRQSGAPASTHFSPQQIAAIRAKLASYGGAVKWGEDFGPGDADPMHFEMAGGGPTNPAVAAGYQAMGGVPGTYGPSIPGIPGSGGQFGGGGVFGGGGGVIPVLVTNWPGGGMGGFGSPQGQQAAQIALGAASPVLGAAGNVIGGVAGDAINAAPAALQSVFESPAGINAPPVQMVSAFNKGDGIQGLLAGAGINVPDMSRSGAVQLAGAQFEQGGAGTGGASYDSEGRLLSATTGLYQRTSSDLNATLVAMRDQLVGATTDVGDKLTKTALTPLLKAGVSAGMGAIPSAVLASMGTSLGTSMAPPIADAVAKDGGGTSTASDISALPFNATAATFQGLNTLVMASGGSVTGGTPGQDSVPILGMPGEWMMTTDEVAKMGGEAGMAKFTDALKKSGGVRYMASGGSVLAGSSGGGTNPGTAGTGTGTLGGDYFGLSQVPLIGGILDILLNILLTMMGIQVSVRDTMLNLTDNFRQFRGDSFKAFTAQGQLLNDTSGLIDRSQTSTELVTDERIRILTQVLEGVIQYILDKVVIPMAEAVAQAAINAAASAGGGALNAVAPGAGSAAGAAASALGDAAVQIGGQVGQDFGDAALGSIFQALSTGLIQNGAGQWAQGLFGGSGTASAPTGVDTGAMSGALGGGIAALLLPLLGLGGLAVTDTTGALFDSGGLATGVGMMPKATIEPERVLDPTTTSNFERLVDVLRGGGNMAGQSTTTVHAPITVMGNAQAGQNVRDSLLSLMT